jgi:predicted MPP superfamily phosphohydrolase
VGTSGAPVRFNCPPEVTLITLRAPGAVHRVA